MTAAWPNRIDTSAGARETFQDSPLPSCRNGTRERGTMSRGLMERLMRLILVDRLTPARKNFDPLALARPLW